jgi:predicted membrane channel-forming protein YqfA (hemolysin III family)
MAAMRIFGALVMLAFYAAAGLAFHLIVHGEVDWGEAFVYVAMAFWPLLLAWELLKLLALVGVVVLAGIGLYLLVREGVTRLGGRA